MLICFSHAIIFARHADYDAISLPPLSPIIMMVFADAIIFAAPFAAIAAAMPFIFAIAMFFAMPFFDARLLRCFSFSLFFSLLRLIVFFFAIFISPRYASFRFSFSLTPPL